MSSVPIVILTALDLEYQAIHAHLSGLTMQRHPAGTRYETGRLTRGTCRIALGLVGAGNQSAAVLAERAITQFRPRAILFVGVAGALWPHVQLGDVVVASRVYAYHGATSQDDGLKARPRSWDISHEPDQIAHGLARAGTWARFLPAGGAAPTVRFGPIAAGEVVQDSATSDQARWLRDIYNDAIAIEMEGAGVAQAGHFNRSLPVVVIRGISDRADGTKATTDSQSWQPRAVENAAAFAVALADELARELPQVSPSTTRRDHAVKNVARDNARVGVQAGSIAGSVFIGAVPDAPLHVAEELAELRRMVQAAYVDGRLDEGTYEAAAHELDVVDGVLPPSTEQRRGEMLVALKKLAGLVMDVAELAAKVTALVVAVRGMS
ncbi:5'-methylthioadenosine/S-adenosylhomocysteine nucleosidase [Dactylosporangium salmoneum]|uniref:Nucleoside phosphorylase domain-containing protein n=1 Tax=Dactylosporangium salmoneum TaxID=53361 RepID=A0ABP5UCN9_9ACTN